MQIIFLKNLYTQKGLNFQDHKVLKKEESYYCPAKEGKLENPNAFCRLCMAEQLGL